MSLLVVGSIAFDSIETPFGTANKVLGGSATFLSIAASYFCPVHMVGVVGGDFLPEHWNTLRQRHINVDAVQTVPSGQTFFWRGRYDFNLSHAHTLDTQLNVFSQFNPQIPEHCRSARYVALGNIDPELQLRVLQQMDQPALVACDTMNFWITNKKDALLKTLQHVDLLSINEGEARQLSGEYNLVHAAKKIFAMGPRILVIKRGEYGAMLLSDNQIFIIPGLPLDVVRDPTGAGDAFAGGMMGLIARSDRSDHALLRQSLGMGTVMASFAVEDFSVNRLLQIDEPVIHQRFAHIAALTAFDKVLA